MNRILTLLFFTFLTSVFQPAEALADSYSIAGGAINGDASWNADNRFSDNGDGSYSLHLNSLGGEFKILKNGDWDTQFGATTVKEANLPLTPGTTYQAMPYGNVEGNNISVAFGALLRDVDIILTPSGDNLEITVTAATVTENPERTVYALAGELNGWNLESGRFAPRGDGSYSLHVAELTDAFKIVKFDTGSPLDWWTYQWGAPDDLRMANASDYTAVSGGTNIWLEGDKSHFYDCDIVITPQSDGSIKVRTDARRTVETGYVYCLAGDWNDWELESGLFELKEGVPTIHFDSFKGEFKVVKYRPGVPSWEIAWGADGDSRVTDNVRYTPAYQSETNMKAGDGGELTDVTFRLATGADNTLRLTMNAGGSGDFYSIAGGAVNGEERWNSDTRFSDNGDGTYSLHLNSLGGEFKILKNGNWDTQFGTIKANNSAIVPIVAGEPYEAPAYGNVRDNNIATGFGATFTDADIRLEPSGDNAVITIYSAGVTEDDNLTVYAVTGAFNQWSLDDRLEKQSDGNYKITLARLTDGFKIVKFNPESTYDWWARQWGSSGTTMSEAVPYLARRNGGDITLEGGTPLETIDLYVNPLSSDAVAVNTTPAATVIEEDAVYVFTGDWNGWSLESGIFERDGDRYVLTVPSLSGTFKIVKYKSGGAHSWDNQWGADGQERLVAGEVYTPEYKGNNIALDDANPIITNARIVLSPRGGKTIEFVITSESTGGGGIPDDEPIEIPSDGVYARVLTTSGDRSQSLRPSYVRAAGASTEDDAIVLTTKRNQTIDGFGYAITYASCYNLMRMPESERRRLIEKTFSPTSGYGVSYVRISIGCNDFSSREYTLADTRGPENDPLANFALQSDETGYVIPILKEILAVNPSLKVIAAPWTCPRWMKNTSGWKGGNLQAKYYTVYGDYFVRFIMAMASEGVSVYAVSPQNEPLNSGNSASLYMPYDQEADFVRTGLAPALHRAGLRTKIYLYDHNYNYDGKADQKHYPLKAYDRMGTGFDGADLVAGACYHSYGGSVSDISEVVYDSHTDKELLFTEHSIGTWNDGRNLYNSLSRDMDEMVIQTLGNRFSGSLVWNFMLDTNRGPNRPDGCTTCYGAIDLNAANTSSYTLNSHYYIMAHASDAVRPGARRLDTKGWWTDNFSYAAFVNPDNTTSVLLCNKKEQPQTVKVNSLGNTYTFDVPARGVVSAVMNLSTGGTTSVSGPSAASPRLRITPLEGEVLIEAADGYAPVTVTGADGRIVWSNIVDGAVRVKLARGLYLVNSRKVRID